MAVAVPGPAAVVVAQWGRRHNNSYASSSSSTAEVTVTNTARRGTQGVREREGESNENCRQTFYLTLLLLPDAAADAAHALSPIKD